MASRHRYQRRRRQRSPGGSAVRGILASAAGLLLAVSVLGAIVAGGAVFAAYTAYAYVAEDLAPPETIATREVSRTAKIFDRKGRLLYEIFDPQLGRRTTVSLREISPYLVQATIATEDADFYENQGINIRGMLRALWNNITSREVVQGGSSITQQLVKNVLIPEEERTQVSIVRKLKEVILSLEITRRFTKDEILEYYLNEIYYGNLSYGIEAAAQSYFAKPALELNLAEAAMLTGLPQAPSTYSPLQNPERARWRQHAVLDLMVRHGFTTRAEAERAKKVKLRYAAATFDILAPHFVAYVRELVAEKYGARTLYRTGLRVTTTLDLDIQALGETIVREQVEKTKDSINAHNAALTALDPRTGEILAMVGSVDYFDAAIDGQVNLVLGERQPGSSFKPFTYLTAFMRGFTPATMLLDVPTTIDLKDSPNPTYTPENVDKKFHGPVQVRQALSNSMNVPAIKTIQYTGVDAVLETAHKMGITTLNRKGWYGLALTLGGGEVKLLDMAYAYGVFANQGVMAGVPVLPENRRPGHRTLDPVAILRIEDADGNLLEEFREPQKRQVISPELAYLVTDILADAVARAPIFGNTLRLPGGRPASVKTGTTEDLRDFWTVGFTPELTVGVWMGNADNTKLTGGYSSTTTGPIWENFMAAVLGDSPATPFPRPAGITTAIVCVPSGLLPGEHCQKKRAEIFLRGQVPTEQDNLYKVFRIDKTNGKLASDETPPEEVEEKVYLMLPQEAQEWAEEHEIEQPPTELSDRHFLASAAITTPSAGSLVSGTLVVLGTAAGDDMEQFIVELGEGAQPTAWTLLTPPRKHPLKNTVLANYDVRQLNGLYTLRLTVQRTRDAPEVVAIPIIMDNIKPVVRLLTPATDALLVMDPAQPSTVFGIQAEARDENGIAAVEFYVDGVLVGMTPSYPYAFQWKLDPGPHVLYAVAVDEAGNTAHSPTVKVRVRGAIN